MEGKKEAEKDWSSLKVAELKVALAERGLVQSGKKADLVARLEAYDEVENKGDGVVGKSDDDASAADKATEHHVVDKGVDSVANTEEEKEEVKMCDEKLPPSSKTEEASEKAQTRKRPFEEGKDQGKTSRALCVLGFQRPFTLTAARALLEQYGSIVDMWMPSIKDRAYVVYSTVAEAEKASAGVAGVTWPANSTKTLEPSYVSVEEAEKAISQGTGNVEYSIARTDEDPVVAEPIPALETSSPPQKKQLTENVATKQSVFRSTASQPMIYWKTCKPL